MADTYPKLIKTCLTCSGKGKIDSPELERDIDRIQDTQGLSYVDAERQAISRFRGEPHIFCSACSGKGEVLSELGVKVKRFISEYNEV
ncbi:hypothetical protein JNUCC31_09075 [Paenibacillus sp. JNUCC31]|uniref:hypothetical protein n=1 Tax=Paenibacillus sp. JNUCC-31 TaxID=2777983 RepID=UPI00177B2C13|nr:hypothetical protein [Paenibacillus sp. JNUCC-31]QOS81001.1 hypothetical protein JNUCC31_09075 [Paenibacillus sp. JNUCC-31]